MINDPKKKSYENFLLKGRQQFQNVAGCWKQFFRSWGLIFFIVLFHKTASFHCAIVLILFFILENKKSGPYRFGVVFLNKKLSERWKTQQEKNKINSYHGSTLSKYSLTAKVSDDNEVKCLTNISLLLSCYLQTIAPL